MKWLLIFCLLVSFSAVAQKSDGNRVALADGKVSFVLPAGFQPMTEEQIQNKYPRGNAPKHVFANDRQSVSIAVTFSPARLAPEQLDEFMQAMEQMLPQLAPDLKWQVKDFVVINGRRWGHFRFTTEAIDTNIMNDMYFTSFEGKALMINFNSAVSQYESVKSALEKSKNSIEVK